MSKVLLVTHASSALNALAAALYERGHDVCATDRRQAVEIAANTTFDAVVTEYVLDERCNGLDVIRAVRALQPEIRAVLMSAVITGDVQAALDALGNVEMLRKPFNIRQLEVAITGSSSGVYPVLALSTPATPSPLPKALVLVIEDDKALLAMCARVLRHTGYQVCLARNGVEALQILDAGARPGLILVDLLMPQMSGAEFLEAIVNRPECQHVPVAVMSGLNAHAVAEFRADACLRKPFTHHELLTMVNGLCGKSGRRQHVSSTG